MEKIAYLAALSKRWEQRTATDRGLQKGVDRMASVDEWVKDQPELIKFPVSPPT